jgi:hypothetical protein
MSSRAAYYEIGGEASHECKLVGLTRPDLELTRLKICKGSFDQLIGDHQNDAISLRKLRGPVGLYSGGIR